MRKIPGWMWPVILGFGILALFLITRLTNLTALPIFTDEAIYIRWSQIGMRDASWRFISLTDGKQPMFTWVMMILLRVFGGADPLFVGRLTSVVAGFFTLIGLWFLSFELFRSRKVAWVAVFLYTIVPFTQWYDRLALYDSMVATFSVWSLYLGILLARYVRLDVALLAGLSMGAGMLNKSSGFLSLYFLPATLLLFDWKSTTVGKRLLQWAMFAGIAAVLSQISYSVLRLSPYFHMVGQKDNVFVFTPSEWLNQPFRFLVGNLRGMFDWLEHYLTLPVFTVAFVPFFTRWKNLRERLLLYVWWALPFAALATFAKVLYPRFILFMTMPLLILAAWCTVRLWVQVKHSAVRWIGLMIILAPSFYATYRIVTNPILAPIPFADRGQLIESWPAGGGVKEVVSFLRNEIVSKKISVYTEGTFGLMPYSLEIYLVDNPNIKIKGIWPLPPVMPEEMTKDALTMPTYFVTNESQQAPAGWNLTLIGEYQKGTGAEPQKLRLYRVNATIAHRGL